MSFKEFALQVVAIAEKASDAILEIYNASEGIKIDKKADDSPLTDADRAANKIICDGLKQLPFPIPIISEENKAIPYEKRKDFGYFWLVDPLDGTKEFIKRNGEFTVNIALVKGNRPVLGVVVAPVLKQSFWAVQGEGAHLVENGKSQQLEATKFKMSDEGLGVVCSRSHLNDETKAIINKLNNPKLVATGSSLKFLILAQGKAQVYPRVAPTMEWDTGAAQIILEEAGGKVVRYDNEEPLEYNKESLLNPYFMAYGNVQ